MRSIRSQDAFLKEQYSTANNLNARGNLHARFRTNPINWFRWVFEHLVIPEDSKILELGCGPAGLWVENIPIIPAPWQVCLSDLSPGMVKAAKENVTSKIDSRLTKQFAYQVLNAQAIPFPDEFFQAIIANHMLYHVSNLKSAITEIHRVLKPGGQLFAATNAMDHIKEIHELRARWLPKLNLNSVDNFGNHPFTLENGEGQLVPPFQKVCLHLYKDDLEVTEPEPLIAYILSVEWSDNKVQSTAEVKALRSYLELEIKKNGRIHISKSTGIFIATKAK